MFAYLHRNGKSIKDAARIVGERFEGAPIPYRTAQRWVAEHREAERTGIGFGIARRAAAPSSREPSSPEGGALNDGSLLDGAEAQGPMAG
ncbi:MAG TPA: hypothetical protein VJ838_14520, partial [Gaiellaceae bacterium]|nr:hypothetical protein [Gaiellaceae bacterium]